MTSTRKSHQHRQTIPPAPLFYAPPLPRCFNTTAPLNLDTLKDRWKAFGTMKLPFVRDQRIPEEHWFYIWKDRTWEELKTELEKKERKTLDSYVNTMCKYMGTLAHHVRGGLIRDRNQFFKLFVPDFRVVQEDANTGVGDTASLTVRVLFNLLPDTCYFETWLRPILKALLRKSSLPEMETEYVQESFKRFCVRSELVLAAWGFRRSHHEQALISYGISFVSQLPNKLSFAQITRFLQISPLNVAKGLNLYLSSSCKIKLPEEQGNPPPPPKNLLNSINPFASGTLPGIEEALDENIDPNQMEHSLASHPRFTHRQRGIYNI